MEDRIKFEGYIHKISVDEDGETTLTLKVSQIYKHIALNLPLKTVFLIHITGNVK